jgi:four helix bundle protein
MKFDLEDRLIRFGVNALGLSEKMPDSKGSNHLAGQLVRSATAPPLMYGEVNAAESPADFVHKMSMALKELRETRNCLRMIRLKEYIENPEEVDKLIDENQELIAIFGASINTARKRMGSTKGKSP